MLPVSSALSTFAPAFKRTWTTLSSAAIVPLDLVHVAIDARRLQALVRLHQVGTCLTVGHGVVQAHGVPHGKERHGALPGGVRQ